MSEDQNPAKRTTKSGISVDQGGNDLGLTATVALSRKGMGLSKKKEAAPAPPPPDKTAALPYSVASTDEVGCPRCQSEFQVSAEFYDAVAECPECALMFVIKAPGTPPYRGPVPGASSRASQSLEPDDMMNTIEMNRNAPAPAAAPPRPAAPRPARTTTSGIDVDKGPQDYGLTATVTLSRRGMGMHQKRKDEIAAPAAQAEGKPYSVATADSVACPKCKASFEISPEFYNAIAECPECSTEFVIKPPGTPPPPRGGSRPVVTNAAGSGPVSVPPGARPAPPQRPQRPAPPAAAPSAPPQRPSAPKAAPKAASAAAKGASRAEPPKRRTETSIKNLDQLTQTPTKPKKTGQGVVMAVIGGVIVLMVVIVIFLVVSLMK